MIRRWPLSRLRYEPNDRRGRLLFLSYTAREPEAKCLKEILDPFLKALPDYTYNRLGVWYDAVDIRHPEGLDGRPLDTHRRAKWLAAQIVKGLSQCDFTVAMLSPKYMQSHWCRFEWRNSKFLHRHPSVLSVWWKEARYFRDYATWTDPYRHQRIKLYEMKAYEATSRLLEEVVDFAERHRPE